MTTRLVKFLAILLVLTVVACNVPSVAPPTDTPINTPLPPTETVEPTITPTPTEVLPQIVGFWSKQDDFLYAYDFDGNPLGIEIDVTGTQNWIGMSQMQVVDDVAYYYNSDAQQVFRSAPGAAPAPVAYIPSNISVYFAVSPDGSKIAWASDGWDTTANKPYSEMWVGNTDGSGASNMANIAAASNDKFNILMPYRWVNDHELLYTHNLTGIGGYILFWGSAGMDRLDINTGISTQLVPPDYGLCLSDISPDQTTIFTTCDSVTSGTRANRIVSLLPGGPVLTLPELADQGQSGSARFSPSGDWIAYSVAKGDMGGERGQVAVVPADGSAAPLVVADTSPGYFSILGWVNETTFLFAKYDLTGTVSDSYTIWKINRDGSNMTQLTTGFFVDWVIR